MDRTRELKRIIEVYERREEIEVGRPLTWAVQFGLVALVASVFWLLYRGAELDTVLYRAAAALVAFGGAGYAAGRLLERAPSPAPVFQAQPDISLAPGGRRVALSDLQPGMVLAEAATNLDGETLVQADTALTEELLEVMREYEIPSAVVKFEEEREMHHD